MTRHAPRTASNFPRHFADIPVVVLIWILLGLACVVQAVLLSNAPPVHLPFDFIHSYQPLAQQLLQTGTSVLWSDESIRVAPVSYVWMALFGADPSAIFHANIAIGIALCLLAFDTTRRLHSISAGLIAAWGISLSPLLLSVLPQPLTEAPFMLFTALWWWGLSGCIGRAGWFAVPTVLGATLSILTRPVWFYPVLLLILLGAAMWWWHRHPIVRRITLLHAAALILPAVVIVKNHVLFEHAVIASGGGAALYYGQHPLTGGMDPPVVGLSYDESLVMKALNVDHLTPVGDKALRRIGMSLLRSRPVPETLAEMPGRVGRVLFFSNRELSPRLLNERALRITEICLALLGLIAARGHPLVRLLAAAIAIQTLQLSMLLYTNRYSIGTIEYPLLLLGGIGVVAALRPLWQALRVGDRRRASCWQAAAVASALPLGLTLVATTGIASGYWIQRFVPIEEARLPAYGDFTRALPAPTPPEVRSANEQAFSPHTVVDLGDSSGPQVRVRIPDPKPVFGDNDLWKLRFSVTPPIGQRCRKVAATFVNLPSGRVGVERMFLVRDDGQAHDYLLGAHAMTSPLYPWSDGELRLTFFCPAGTKVAVQEAALHESRMPEIFAPLVDRLAKELQ